MLAVLESSKCMWPTHLKCYSGTGTSEHIYRTLSILRDSCLSSQPTTTVIVCTRNRAATLRRCLEHISKLEYPNFTVLVVDNGSKDLTAQIAQDAGADYLLVQQPGLSRARNAGVRHSSTEIVAFIDDDAVPYPAWLSKLVEFFDDPNVMAVGGHYQPFDDPVLPQGLAPLVLDKTNPEWLPIAAFGGIGDGCNMAFRRSAFSVWRGFDERMGRGAEIDGGEEHLGFATLTAKGYRCVFAPAAMVHHGYRSDQNLPPETYHSSVAYALMLFKELPEQRSMLISHLFRSALGGARTWRQHRYGDPESATGASAMAKLSGLLGGVRLFLGAWRQGERREPLLVSAAVQEQNSQSA